MRDDLTIDLEELQRVINCAPIDKEIEKVEALFLGIGYVVAASAIRAVEMLKQAPSNVSRLVLSAVTTKSENS